MAKKKGKRKSIKPRRKSVQRKKKPKCLPQLMKVISDYLKRLKKKTTRKESSS